GGDGIEALTPKTRPAAAAARRARKRPARAAPWGSTRPRVCNATNGRPAGRRGEASASGPTPGADTPPPPQTRAVRGVHAGPGNSPARAAIQAYTATMICTTTNGQKVGLRSEFTADVTTPVAIPTPGPASAVARIVPVVSRNRGNATASTAAERARLIAAATG